MPKSLNEWKKTLEKLSGEDLENIVKGIKSIKKVNGLLDDYQWTGITAFGELANEVLEERLRDMERVKSPEELLKGKQLTADDY